MRYRAYINVTVLETYAIEYDAPSLEDARDRGMEQWDIQAALPACLRPLDSAAVDWEVMDVQPLKTIRFPEPEPDEKQEK